ncbi:MAG TPA: hypothetical protein VJ488_00065 [Dehalococcoidia bacterium]|nr:hypothetical protein [Dehalococcoidia bacterium]
MAVKKAAPAKKKATAKKAAPIKKAVAAVKKAVPAKAKSKNIKKGAKFECAVCGMAITVDRACGCVGVCDILCCGKPMKAKAAK